MPEPTAGGSQKMSVFDRLKSAGVSIVRSASDWYRDRRGLPPVVEGSLQPEDTVEYLKKSNPVILDVGCNDGYHTGRYLNCYENATIYCFEPDGRAIRRFQDKYRSVERVHLIEAAVSDRSGVIQFHRSTGRPDNESNEIMPDGWDLSGSIRRPKLHLREHPWVRFDDVVEVETISLDAWYKNSGV
jgi:FkbM family methyltransferase